METTESGWEYSLVWVVGANLLYLHGPAFEGKEDSDFSRILEVANYAGARGWEMLSPNTDSKGDTEYWFKRRRGLSPPVDESLIAAELAQTKAELAEVYRQVLIGLSGIVCTPQEGYTSVGQVRSSFRDLRTAEAAQWLMEMVVRDA